MIELRKAYHQFLNSTSARDVDPVQLCDYLRRKRIVDDEEVDLVKMRPTLTSRQYCFFLEILPTKGPAGKELIEEALLQLGYGPAAEVWSRCCDKVKEEYIVPRRVDEFESEPCRVRYICRDDTAFPTDHVGLQGVHLQGLTLQGAWEQPTQPTPPPPGWIIPPHIPPQPPQSPPEVPTAPTFLTRILQSSFLTRTLGHGGPPQLIPATLRIQQFDQVEHAATVAHASSLGVPPPPQPTSSGYGSAGATVHTPDAPPALFRDQPVLPVVDGILTASNIKLGEQIGRGAFAYVFAGQYANKRVAVKKFRDYDEFSLTMFIEEVKIMKDLTHRNVVKFVGYVHSSENRDLWLVTEFIPGGELRRFCTPTRISTQLEKSLPLKEKLKIAVDCWQGLDYIHGKNLCHKDISPGNILVSNDLAQVKISDFGLAEFKNVIMTATTQVSGTPMYYPPEFASEDGVIRHPVKSDIYSMGASLCELFSEQWFWNIDGKPRQQFQVMFILGEQRRSWTQKGVVKEPDCWANLPSIVQPMLNDAIKPDYHTRKSARELCIASQQILKQIQQV